MRRVPLAAAALLLAAAAFAADPDPAPTQTPPAPQQTEPKFKTMFIGEGGGYKAPDKATDDYLIGNQPPPSNASTPAAAAPGAGIPAAAAPGSPAAPAAVAGKSAPASVTGIAAVDTSRPASPRIDAPNRPSAARPAAEGRNASIPGDARPAGRQSLWNGLVQPLEMTAAQAGAASDPDAARAQSDRDYETHILGMNASSPRPELGAPAPAGRAASMTAAAARADGGKVFVSLTLDPRETGSLRDAVAGLGAASGFTADARFEAMPGPNGTVLYSGWIPAGRLGDAMARPGVKSLRVETRPQPSNPRETSGEFLIGLHLEDPARAREGVDAGVRALTQAADFRLTRIVGLETAPDGRTVGVVAGVLPLSRLERAMGLSEVAKIMPVGGEVPPPADPAGAAGKGGLKGFAKFAVERGPWLIILTLLLLLPSLRAPARRAAAVFSPYR